MFTACLDNISLNNTIFNTTKVTIFLFLQVWIVIILVRCFGKQT